MNTPAQCGVIKPPKTDIYSETPHFPAPIRLGGTASRAVGWRRTEIQAWIDERPRAA